VLLNKAEPSRIYLLIEKLLNFYRFNTSVQLRFHYRITGFNNPLAQLELWVTSLMDIHGPALIISLDYFTPGSSLKYTLESL